MSAVATERNKEKFSQPVIVKVRGKGKISALALIAESIEEKLTNISNQCIVTNGDYIENVSSMLDISFHTKDELQRMLVSEIKASEQGYNDAFQ